MSVLASSAGMQTSRAACMRALFFLFESCIVVTLYSDRIGTMLALLALVRVLEASFQSRVVHRSRSQIVALASWCLS